MRALVHSSFGREAFFHVDLWLDHLLAVSPAIAVVVRTPELYREVRRRRPDVRVLYAGGAADVYALQRVLPELRVVFYVSNSLDVFHFVRLLGMRHVFLGHGDSDKAASYARSLRLYDEIWVAGSGQEARLDLVDGGTGLVRRVRVGRPELRRILSGVPALESVPRRERPVLYLPTWEGPSSVQDYSSLALAPDIVDAVMSTLATSVVCKAHPWTGRRDSRFGCFEAALARSSRPHAAAVETVARDRRASDLFAESACLISDVSSVVIDYLITGRPIFVFDRQVSSTPPATQMPVSEYAYVFTDAAGLRSALERVLRNRDDPLADARRRAAAYYIDVEATRAGAFGREVARVMSGSSDE